jgi:hypothetical protein
MTVTIAIVWPFTTRNVVFPCDRHRDKELCLIDCHDFNDTTKKWFCWKHIVAIYCVIHTVDHQSTQTVHLTTTILNLQHVSVCHQTIFMETKYSTKLLITYINALSNFNSVGHWLWYMTLLKWSFFGLFMLSNFQCSTVFWKLALLLYSGEGRPEDGRRASFRNIVLHWKLGNGQSPKKEDHFME